MGAAWWKMAKKQMENYHQLIEVKLISFLTP